MITIPDDGDDSMLVMKADIIALKERVNALSRRVQTFDEFIDSLDAQNEYEWELIERIDKIHRQLHGDDAE